MVKPDWLIEAEKHIGLKEVPGVGNNPTIVKWLTKLKAWWRNDLEPWCGTFAAWSLLAAGIPAPSAWYRAKAYLNWGNALAAPAYGCIVVFTRTGGGHVGFVVGRDEHGRLMVLGGNQSQDRVSIAPFEQSRVAGYRWPRGTIEPSYSLPIITSTAPASSNEA